MLKQDIHPSIHPSNLLLEWCHVYYDWKIADTTYYQQYVVVASVVVAVSTCTSSTSLLIDYKYTHIPHARMYCS